MQFFKDVVLNVFDNEDDYSDASKAATSLHIEKCISEMEDTFALEDDDYFQECSSVSTPQQFTNTPQPQFIYKPRMNAENRKMDLYCEAVNAAVFGPSPLNVTNGSPDYFKNAENYALNAKPTDDALYFSRKFHCQYPKVRIPPKCIPGQSHQGSFYKCPPSNRKTPAGPIPNHITPNFNFTPPTGGPSVYPLPNRNPAANVLTSMLQEPTTAFQRTGEMLLIYQLLQTHISQAGIRQRLYQQQQQLQQGNFFAPGADFNVQTSPAGNTPSVSSDDSKSTGTGPLEQKEEAEK